MTNIYGAQPVILVDGAGLPYDIGSSGSGASIFGAKPVILVDANGSTYTASPWVNVPASGTASGAPGQLAQDGSYLYVCTAVNTWKRVALATF